MLVCTANRFRSPLLEAYLRAFTQSLPVSVSSAGVQRRAGQAALPEAVALAAEAGFDLSGHRARGLTTSDLANADLVIGFERAHVSYAVVEGGASYERTFGVIELVRLLESLGPVPGNDVVDRARRAVEMAHERRAPLRSPWVHMQIPDPVGGSPAAYRRTAIALGELGGRLAAALFGVTSPS